MVRPGSSWRSARYARDEVKDDRLTAHTTRSEDWVTASRSISGILSMPEGIG